MEHHICSPPQWTRRLRQCHVTCASLSGVYCMYSKPRLWEQKVLLKIKTLLLKFDTYKYLEISYVGKHAKASDNTLQLNWMNRFKHVHWISRISKFLNIQKTFFKKCIYLSLQLMESKGLYHLPCTIVNSPSATNLADHIQVVNYAK